MLQLVNDYRSLGIDPWLLAIVCPLIGRKLLLAGHNSGRRNSGHWVKSPWGYIPADRGSLLVLLVRILLVSPGYHYCWWIGCNYPFNYSCLFKVI